MRIAAGIEYNGSNYHGWQSQDSGIATIQSSVEEALSSVANHVVSVQCAGRTDAIVHAFEQVIHFDTVSDRTDYSWVFGTNSNLPPDIAVIWVKRVPDSFNARFSALARTYRYVIYNQSVRPSLWRQQVTWLPRKLDATRMQEAAQYLLGEQDFSSFRSIHCQSKTPMRNVLHIKVERHNHWVIIDVKANSFLHHMVRNIAGMLLIIGEGKQDPIWAKEVLEARDRNKGGITAPPYGLYFLTVDYPEEFALPQRAEYDPVYQFIK
jgi:tRNA pseudouridine38-40 synthase